MFSLNSITSALQTAARLSQQAELGGILEEIEVSSLTSTRWCCVTVILLGARHTGHLILQVLVFLTENTFFAFFLSGFDRSFG